MRLPRIKIPPAEGEAVYHCISRTVNGERLFDDVAMEILRQHMWQVAEYCGVDILTYTLLSNHFHILVRIPKRQEITDSELLRRYSVLEPRAASYVRAMEAELANNTIDGIGWRERQLRLMGDVSPFMKLFKQRFSIWFNSSHQRFGTLWADRFKSTLVESERGCLQKMAAYIDLNCVRAGIVTDPKDYRFCGYAEAVAGNPRARAGVLDVLGSANWTEGQAQYREILFGTGTAPRESAAAVSISDFARVIADGGMLPLATLLRCRIRYFTDGAVLGSRAFVQTQLAKHRPHAGKTNAASPHLLPPCTDWGDMAILHALRRPAFG